MAVDVSLALTANGVINKIHQDSPNLNLMNIDTHKQKMKENLKILKETEDKFLSLFKGVNSINDLNKKVQELENDANSRFIVLLSGDNLVEKFLKEGEKSTYAGKLREQKIQKILKYFENEILNSEETITDVGTFVFNKLKDFKTKDNVGTIIKSNLLVKKSKGNIVTIKDFEDALRNRCFSSNTIKRMEEMTEVKNFNRKGSNKIIDIIKTDEGINIVSLGEQYDNATGEERLERIEDLINFIFQQVGLSKSNNPILENTIRKMLNTQNVKLNFASNLKYVTGFLGELKTIYILENLFENAQNIQWIAQKFGKITNPHADIMVNTAIESFGIQSKNTQIEDYHYNINFYSREILNNFEKKGIGFLSSSFFNNIDTETKQAINDVFAMKAFNIEYQKENDIYVAKPNSKFKNLRTAILTLSERATYILNVFASDLLYMQVNKGFFNDSENAPKNTIYFIKDRFFSAFKALTEIYNKLYGEGGKLIKFSSRATDKNNIVTYLNNNKQHHEKEFAENVDFNIKLTSSWAFS